MQYSRTKVYSQDFVDSHTCDYQTDNKKFQDLTGMVFGKLTVLKLFERKPPHTHWFCKCSCGNIVTKSTNQLNGGTKLRCTVCGFKDASALRKIDVQARISEIKRIHKNLEHLVVRNSEKTRWVFYCPLCDTEFHQPSSVLINQHYKGTPCRCDNGVKFTQWTTELREEQIHERCEELGLTFLGWENDNGYERNTSRIKITCGNHEPYGISINNFIGTIRYGCPHCAEESRGDRYRHDYDKIVIEGKKLYGDKYDYSEYEYICSRTPSRIFCNQCQLPFSASYDNHINKQRGCPHEKGKSSLYTYLLGLYENGVPIGIKLGKAAKYDKRINEHINGNKHLIIKTIGVWEYVDTVWCNKAEAKAKRLLPCAYLDPRTFTTGSTETLPITEVDRVIEIFENTGGTRIL